MKKTLLSLIGMFFILSAQAQQEAQYTQFMYSQGIYNPAYVGSRGMPSIQTIFRRQWINYEGAPTSAIISFNAPIIKNRVGIGLNLSTVSIGIQNFWQASMSYSYNVNIEQGVDIRIGFMGSMKNLAMNFQDESLILLQDNDPSLIENMVVSTFTGNFGIGLYGTVKNIFFGISVPSLLKNEISFNEENLVILAEEAQHYYFLLGGIFPVSDQLRFRPSILGKYVENAPFDIDLNFSFIYENRVTGGLSYRAGGTGAGESLDLTFLYQMKEAGIGIAYDISLSEISTHSAGTFEILLRYDFIKDKQFFNSDMSENLKYFF